MGWEGLNPEGRKRVALAMVSMVQGELLGLKPALGC